MARVRAERQIEERRPPLAALLQPRAVAVVGASPDASKPGGRFVSSLARYGFRGPVYPVNPRYADTADAGYHRDLGSLPGPVDLAVLLVPAKMVPDSLRQAAAAGIRAAMICSSGFSEAGEDGKRLQEEIRHIAERENLAVLGPNCVGMADLGQGLVASFSNAFDGDNAFTPGPISFVSQSGAMGAAVFRLAQSEGIGVGRFLSTGNEAVLDFCDFVDCLVDDAGVAVILGYVEGLGDGARLLEVAARARAAGKPLAIVKVGRSEAGSRAALSHTGALVGSTEVFDAVCRRAGIYQARGVRDLLDLAVALPRKVALSGRRVGVVSSSGGAAVMMTDACVARGLTVRAFSRGTCARLADTLPAYVGFSNPVDYGPVYGDPDAIEACLHAVASDPDIDAVLFFLALSPAMAGIVEPRLARVQEQAGKPVFAVWMAPPQGVLASLRDHGVAAYDDIGRAVEVLAMLAPSPGFAPEVASDPSDARRRDETRAALETAWREGRRILSERETKRLLGPYGVPVTRDCSVGSAQEAEQAVAAMSGKAVVKADAPDLLHKSDAGAVRLNVTADTAREAYEAVVVGASTALGTACTRALVQPMIEPGLEVILGIRHDPVFGPAVSLGLGGVMTEVLADVVVELAPVDHRIALSMIERLQGARLFAQFRGGPERDRVALADAIVGVSRFARDAGPLLLELDLNPAIVHAVGEGCVVVDAAAVLSEIEQRDING